MTRARLNKSYWGGSSVRGVCLKEGQFQRLESHCDHSIRETAVFNRIKQITNRIYEGIDRNGPTDGADRFNNTTIENPLPACEPTVIIGRHQFYRSLKLQ